MNDHQLKTLASLCSGVALLIMFAVAVSGNSPFLSSALKFALQDTRSNSAAAAWWAQYPVYDVGWPLPHSIGSVNNAGGWCNAHFFSCPLPSYADAYVQSDPTQKIIASVVLPGFFFTFLPYQGPTYTGPLSLSVPSGSPVVIDWACQDWQGVGYSYPGTCNNLDAVGNCIGYGPGGGGVDYRHDYGSAVGSGFGAGPPVGSATVNPAVTTTYSVYCASAGYTTSNGIPFPSSPWMSFTVNVTEPPPPPPPPPPPGATPSIEITGNGEEGTVTVAKGDSVTVHAEFRTNDEDDDYVATAINNFNSTKLWCGTDDTGTDATCDESMWIEPPINSKEYEFNTTGMALGSYKFVPSMKTVNYPDWDDHGQNLIVDVVNKCAGGEGPEGACTDCDDESDPVGGLCLPPPVCTNGTINPSDCDECPLNSNQVFNGSSCVCDIGFQPVVGAVPLSCIPDVACGDPTHQDASCNCIAPWKTDPANPGKCKIVPTIVSFKVDQIRVRSGNVATLSWDVTGLPQDLSAATCTITSNPNVLTLPLTDASLTEWKETAYPTTGTLSKTTTFTMNCTNATPVSTSVGIIPPAKEN